MSTIHILALLTLTLVISAVQGTGNIGLKANSIHQDEGEVDPDDLIQSCSTTGTRGTPPTLCPTGQVCVITDFGRPEVDIPDSGFCADVPSSQRSPCDLASCAANGGRSICSLPSESSKILTCAAWSKTSVEIAPGETVNLCNQFACLADCPSDAVSSLGRTFCNACNLQVASCRASFSFTGPVDIEKECSLKPRISPFLSGVCCTRFGKGCIKSGKPCSTGGGLLPAPPCEKDNVCVLNDFGFPAADVPSSGICKKINPDKVAFCTVLRCALGGKNRICKIDEQIATCRAWATRKDGGTKPNCNINCRRSCRHPSYHVWAKRCGLCRLFRKRCRLDFAI